jgi:hypothetical protein
MSAYKGKRISSLRVEDLRKELGRRGLHRLGKKDELVQRLQSWLEVSDEEGGAGNHSSSQGDKDDEMLEEGRERVREMLRPSSRSISSSDSESGAIIPDLFRRIPGTEDQRYSVPMVGAWTRLLNRLQMKSLAASAKVRWVVFGFDC